jgi:hypothetical protein
MAEVSWGLLPVEASKIYFDPEKSIKAIEKKNKQGVTSCPSVLKLLQKTHIIKCPFDLKLRFTGSLEAPEIRPIEEFTSIHHHKLKSIFSLSPRKDWLNEEFPVFQITTPYVFTSKEEIDIIQKFPRDLIGTNCPFRLIEGQFPIDTWVRPLSWAVEWIDIKKDITLRRGQSWFDITFAHNDFSKNLKLSKVELEDKILKEIESVKDITGYIKGTSKLMER